MDQYCKICGHEAVVGYRVQLNNKNICHNCLEALMTELINFNPNKEAKTLRTHITLQNIIKELQDNDLIEQ